MEILSLDCFSSDYASRNAWSWNLSVARYRELVFPLDNLLHEKDDMELNQELNTFYPSFVLLVKTNLLENTRLSIIAFRDSPLRLTFEMFRDESKILRRERRPRDGKIPATRKIMFSRFGNANSSLFPRRRCCTVRIRAFDWCLKFDKDAEILSSR